MRHKKLSQQDIKNIRERLLEPLTSKIEDIKKQIGERMVKIIDGETPRELLPFVKENSGFVKTTKYIYLWNLDYSDKYITLGEFVSENDTVIDKASMQCEDMVNQIKSVKQDIKQMTNRINCTLNTIGTTRKLEQEWPEAYKAYLESINMEPEEKDNGCDQVESLRAELSQLKPTGNDWLRHVIIEIDLVGRTPVQCRVLDRLRERGGNDTGFHGNRGVSHPHD